MAISYNTGTTSTVNNSGTASHTMTVPAGVAVGDVVIVYVFAFDVTGSLTGGTISLTSTATAPTAIGSAQTCGSGAVAAVGQAFYFVAGASDPGATLTFSSSLPAAPSAYYYDVGLAAYSGASNAAPIDVHAETAVFSSSNTGTNTTQTATTASAGDWQIQIIGDGPPNNNTYTVPGGLTLRAASSVSTSGANGGLLLQFADSNGSVGAAGTSIGGTSWTCGPGAAGNNWWTTFTIGLAPAAASAPAVYGAQRQAVRARTAATAQPAAQRIRSSRGAPVRNPVAGPVFRQAVQPVRARLPQQQFDVRGRSYGISAGAPVRNPVPVVTGPPFSPARQPARIRPSLPLRGRNAGSQGAPVRNPVQGPAFRQVPRPAQARVPLPARGRTAQNPGGPVRNPVPVVTGPPFYPLRWPARIRPSLPPRGRTGSNAGGPVANPTSGPPILPAGQPAGGPVVVLRTGVAMATPVGPVQNPSPVTTGPVFRPAVQAIRIRPSLPPRGRNAGNSGASVRNPVQGAAFPAPHGPVRARLPQQPFLKGRMSSGPGAPLVTSGPAFRQAPQPARIRPSLPPRGRTAGNPGIPVAPPVAPAPVYPLHGPVRARFPLPPSGRVASNPGGPVQNPVIRTGPPFVPLHWPARIRPSLPPRGRITGNLGGPVRNPVPGPAFRQAVRPIRAVIPQNAPRGRIRSSAGGPVANIPLASPVFHLGIPYSNWDTGTAKAGWQ